jgi:hypothetical protein
VRSSRYLACLFSCIQVAAMYAGTEVQSHRDAGLKREVRLAEATAPTILLAESLAACFGGGGSNNTVAGTPPGTYALTITATSGSATRILPPALIVQ